MKTTHPQHPRQAFTLIELLVVIAIILILMRILLPVADQAKQAGRAVACVSNLHQFGIAMQMFADDHQDNYPQNWGNSGPVGGCTWSGTWTWNGCTGWEVPTLQYISANVNLFQCPTNIDPNCRGMGASAPAGVCMSSSYRMNGTFQPLQDTSVRQSKLASPSSSILLCEGFWNCGWDQVTAPGHTWGWTNWCMDIASTDLETGPNVDWNRHKGKSNYLFFDGHVDSLPWSKTWAPVDGRLNMWRP